MYGTQLAQYRTRILVDDRTKRQLGIGTDATEVWITGIRSTGINSTTNLINMGFTGTVDVSVATEEGDDWDDCSIEPLTSEQYPCSRPSSLARNWATVALTSLGISGTF